MCMHACMLCYILMHAGLNKFIVMKRIQKHVHTKKYELLHGCGLHCMIPTGLPAWMVSKERGLSQDLMLYIIYS